MNSDQLTHANVAELLEEVYLPVRITQDGYTPLLYQAHTSKKVAEERADSTAESFNCETRVLTIKVNHNVE